VSLATEQLLLPVRTPAISPERQRQLRPLDRPQQRRRPKLAYAIIALAGAAIIGIAQMGLSIATTQDSFTVSELTAQNRELTLQAQALSESIAGVSSPQQLAQTADAMGMVVGGSPSYLRLSDGALIGAGVSTGWSSSVNPNGAGAVANALIVDTPPAAAAQSGAEGVEPGVGTTATTDPDVPPIAEGLPSPTTR